MKISTRAKSALRTGGACIVASALVGLGHVPTARASEADKAACADAYKNAQTQRKSGALKRARESLMVCVSDRCPAVFQPDCARWLTEVEAAMPSVSFAAKDAAGKDVVDARVSVDGLEVAQSLDGKAVNLDPGSHVVRFDKSGEAPIEETVIVREGEKARIVSVSWSKALAVATAPEPEPVKVTSSTPVAAWVVGGVGVASLATFGVLGLTGMQRRSSLESDCYGSCSQSDVDAVKTQFLIADVALGVGVVALGVSAVLFLTHASEGKPAAAQTAKAAPPPVAVDFSIKPGGGTAGLVGRF